MLEAKPIETLKSARGGRRVGAGRKPGSAEPRFADGWYVYVIAEKPAHGYIKVGIANKPYQRLCAAQTSNPRILEFTAIWSLGSSDTYSAIERALHKALRPFHVRGEWFEGDVALVERHLNEIVAAVQINAKRVL